MVRGGGDLLLVRADGEALLYCDAGCTLRHEGSATSAQWDSMLRALREGQPIDCFELSGTTIDGKPVTNGAWCTGDVATSILLGSGGSVAAGEPGPERVLQQP